MVKGAHLEKVGKRAERVLDLLLPWEVPLGEVADPKKRLRDIIVRVDGGRSDDLAADVWAVTELLETDIPELIQAVRDAQADAARAREELNHLAMERAGRRYQVTVYSDAPIKVTNVETAE